MVLVLTFNPVIEPFKGSASLKLLIVCGVIGSSTCRYFKVMCKIVEPKRKKITPQVLTFDNTFELGKGSLNPSTAKSALSNLWKQEPKCFSKVSKNK